VRTGGLGKHNFLIDGAFRKVKYEIRRRWKKIGIGKRGRAKIPSPQPPSFLPARAIGFQNSEFGFSSKKVRISSKRHRQSSLLGFWQEFWTRFASPLQGSALYFKRIFQGFLKLINNYGQQPNQKVFSLRPQVN